MIYTTDRATIRHSDFTDEERNSIDEIVVSKKTRSLHKEAFAGFVNLKKVTFIVPFKRCEANVFKGCVNLKEVILPEGLDVIPVLFLAGTGIETVRIPGSVKRIEYGAFEHCPELKEAVIPGSITQIAGGIFEYDSRLEKICLPANMTSIDSHAFHHCPETVQIVVEKGSATEKLLLADRFLEKVYDRKSVLKREKIEEFKKVALRSRFEAGCNELGLELKIREANNFLQNRWFDVRVRNGLVLSFEDIRERTEAMEENVSLFFESLREFQKNNGGLENLDARQLFNLGNLHFDGTCWEISSEGKKTAVHVLNKYRGKRDDIQYMSLGNETKSVSLQTFDDFLDLKKIVLNQGLEAIKSAAFSGCTLEELHYSGTVGQWSKIKKAGDWADGAEIDSVKCSDGEVPVI